MIRVAVISGGDSSEREIGIKSARSIADSLDSGKYDVHICLLDPGNWHVRLPDGSETPIDKADFSFEAGGKQQSFDLAVPMIHGHPAEDGVLQGYFDTIGLPYTGCGSHVSALTFDKLATKRFLRDVQGLELAGDRLLKHPDLDQATIDSLCKLSFPLFVKPNRNGSSYGVSRVENADQLSAAVATAFEFDDTVLVEEFIEGVELACGVYELEGELHALPVTEIVPENSFFDYEAKYEGKSQEITPARISDALTDRCRKLSVEIFREIACRGLARVDFILKGDRFFLLEINTIPGQSPESIVPQQLASAGMTLGELFGKLIDERLRAIR